MRTQVSEKLSSGQQAMRGTIINLLLGGAYKGTPQF